MNPKRRGIKKAAIPEVKITVVGAPQVGKSALTVRFLTKRFIWEYHNQEDFKYRHEMFLDGDPLVVEIMDTCPKDTDAPDSSTLQWADAICLVYSVTNRESFNFVRHFKEAHISSEVPLTLVGNKADLSHLRQVSYEEGEILAKDFECSFAETAVTEQVDQIADVFKDLCKDVLTMRRRAKHSLLDRMLGSRSTRVYSRGKSDSALPKE